MLRILLTGVATLDIINKVRHFPLEDSEVRATDQHQCVGGNACNSAMVMQQLGIGSSLLANFADDSSADVIKSELTQQTIDISLCPVEPDSHTPTSYITLNTSNGSRSIVHYRKLGELHAGQFTQLPVAQFDWLHFEGRNCEQLLKMLQHAVTYNKPVSIELEKLRDGIDEILAFAQVLLISKPFAIARGFTNANDCLAHFGHLYPHSIITCTWGDQGAWLYEKNQIIHQPAFNIENAVDTLGAGDTFNAAFIAMQAKHYSAVKSLRFACELAASKCTQHGFQNLTIPILA